MVIMCGVGMNYPNASKHREDKTPFETMSNELTEHHSHRFCVAPMMDGTDRHCRYFHRLLSRHARLYTEMVTADAILRGDRDRLLGFDEAEHPVALQLGGSDPEALAQAAKIGADFGYDEVNLNVGCPSDRVQSGAFGACLMKTPELVADCVDAMRSAIKAPVTVKCRIGVDDQDPEESLYGFIDTVSKAGCEIFIVHARKAWLEGLSPKQNRDIPPLDYDLVRRLKKDRQDLSIILNGGITSVAAASSLVGDVDGVMLGRAPYAEPYMLEEVDSALFDTHRGDGVLREDIVEAMSDYIAQHTMQNSWVKPNHVARHMLGLYHGQPGARLWRRAISEAGSSADVNILKTALTNMKDTLCGAAS